MIIKNTPANRSLVRKMRNAVNACVDFRAEVDFTWNCKADIRFEIASIGMEAPLIVSTCLHEDGHLEITTRLLVKQLNAYETMRLGNLLLDVDRMTARLEELAIEYAPIAQSGYAA